jgi:hypothetical protein
MILLHTEQCLFLETFLDMGKQGRFTYSSRAKNKDE